MKKSDSSPTDVERTQRLIAMGEMAATLAHEIRNPLGSMELYCSLLKQDLKSLPEQARLAELIHEGIRRLERIISNSLQFCRDYQPRLQPVTDLSGLLSSLLDYLAAAIQRSHVEISVTVERNLGRVIVDPHLFSQAVSNVILNAIEAIEGRACDNARIQIRAEQVTAEVWQLEISDNGPGFSIESLGRVFDPFFTTKVGGTGLGLALVDSIIRAHGGRVEIGNHASGGAQVRLLLPRMQDSKEENAGYVE